MNRRALVCVPLYETLGDNAIQYIVQHSEAALVVAAAGKLPALAKVRALEGSEGGSVRYVACLRVLGRGVDVAGVVTGVGQGGDAVPGSPRACMTRS